MVGERFGASVAKLLTRNCIAQEYYILVVVPSGKDGEYRRVGVAKVRTGYVERLRSKVRIV
jgi:hypothetical protein